MSITDLLVFWKANEPQVKSKWVDCFDQMAVHSRKYSPKKLIEITRPSEPKDILNYRLATDEPITHASINEAIIRASKIIHNSNYSVDLSEELSNYIKDNFIEEFDSKGTPDLVSFEDVLFNRCFRYSCETGNGVIAWIPMNAFDVNAAPINQAATEQVRLSYSIIEPKNIIALQSNYFIFRLKNKYKVVRDEMVSYEDQYMYIDKNRYVLLLPFFDKTSISYTESPWYNIASVNEEGIYVEEDAADTLPIVITKGYATYDIHQNLYYESYFSGFVPLANEAKLAYSDDKAVRLINNFPVREEKEEECDACHGTGKINDVTCGSCGGTGYKSAKSPYSTYKKREPALGQDSEWAKVPALTYIEPPVQALKHSFEVWQLFLDKAEQKVNIKFIDDAQSGVAKDIDREGLIDLRLSISNNFFDNIMYKSFWICEILLKPNSADRQEPIIKKPTAADLNYKSTAQLITDLQQYSNGSVPHFVGSMKILETIGKLFPDDLQKQKFTKVLMFVDPLFGYSTQETSMIVQNSTTKKAVITHLYAEHELIKLSMEDEDLFQKDIKTIAELLIKKLDVYLTPDSLEITNLFPIGS